MALLTAQDFILNALRKCGQIRPGYVPAPELLADGLNEWGVLFDSWNSDRTMGFSVPDLLYPVTGPGSQSNGNGYDIGPSATNWPGPRPASIVRANCVITSTGPSPVYIPLHPISAEEWASLSIRQIPAINLTNIFYYDPQWPNGVFNVFPPMTGNSIEIFTSPALAVPATLAAPYSAPPAYQDAVIKSLAERLWPMCTHAVGINKVSLAYLSGSAYEACQKVRIANRPLPKLRSDFPNGQRPAGYYDSNVTNTGQPY